MRALRFAVGALGDVLLTAGLLLLLFVAWQLWWTDVEANRSQAGTVEALARDFSQGRTGRPAPQGPSPTDTSTARPGSTQIPAAEFGEAFAILRIPRFGQDYARPVLKGTATDTLREGVGQYEGTAGPGAVGNFALAGHRTTYGRPFNEIDELRKGDVIVVETKTGYAVYAVQRYVIVAPSAVEVIAPVPQQPGATPTEAWLTMTACHPEYSAAQRYVVFASLVKSYTRAQGLPAGTLDAPVGRAS